MIFYVAFMQLGDKRERGTLAFLGSMSSDAAGRAAPAGH
jgi:hypothetical protein